LNLASREPASLTIPPTPIVKLLLPVLPLELGAIVWIPVFLKVMDLAAWFPFKFSCVDAVLVVTLKITSSEDPGTAVGLAAALVALVLQDVSAVQAVLDTPSQ
jgi:hypothetical protein